MSNINFNVSPEQDNVIRVPIRNPGGATSGRFLVDTGNGLGITNEVTITIEGDYAVMTIPAAMAKKMYNAKWVLQAFDGATPVDAARGVARVSDGPTQSVSGTVELGSSSLSNLETVNLGPSSEIIGYTSNALARKVAEGKVFISGATVSLGGLASTDRACFQVVNPATSTKVMYVFALTLYSSIAQQIVYMEDADMGGTPTSLVPFNLNRASAASSLMTASYSSAAPSGGVTWPNQSRVQPDGALTIQFPPLIMPPNKSILIRGTSGDAQIFTANLYWFEE